MHSRPARIARDLIKQHGRESVRRLFDALKGNADVREVQGFTVDEVARARQMGNVIRLWTIEPDALAVIRPELAASRTVWHYTVSPGERMCGEEYANMHTTTIPANVTCTTCEAMYEAGHGGALAGAPVAETVWVDDAPVQLAGEFCEVCVEWKALRTIEGLGRVCLACAKAVRAVDVSADVRLSWNPTEQIDELAKGIVGSLAECVAMAGKPAQKLSTSDKGE